MLTSLICAMGALFTGALVGAPTTFECVDPSSPEVIGEGWYNGYEDRIYVLEGLGLTYTLEVVAHEAVHVHDLRLGTERNGYPSFFSETRTGFDVEEFAIMVTWINGWWPQNEVYRGPVPSEDDQRAMEAAGWLPEGWPHREDLLGEVGLSSSLSGPGAVPSVALHTELGTTQQGEE